MLDIDGKLKYGFSRELLCRAMMSERMTTKYGKQVSIEILEGEEKGMKKLEKQPLMDKKKRGDLLMASNYRTKGM